LLSTVLLLASCVALGYWQIGRAREKQALIDEFKRGSDTLIDVTQQAFDSLPRYQSVSLRGAYEPRRQILLDNMPSATGRPGYRVLTPFRRAGAGKLVIIDRGWVPLGSDRDQLPAVQVAADAREIAGRIDRLPEPGVRAGPVADENRSGWPRVLNFPTDGDLATAVGEPVESFIVLLHPEAPDGFERKWRPALRVGPERHWGYAVQWFALAVLAVVVFVAMSLRRESAPAERGP
jgi:surfeit locus 1 family protein